VTASSSMPAHGDLASFAQAARIGMIRSKLTSAMASARRICGSASARRFVASFRSAKRITGVKVFLHYRIDLGLDLKVPKKRGIEPIVSAVNRLPDEQRQILDPAFRNIQALANEAGLKHVIDEACYSGHDITEDLEPHRSFLDKMAGVYLDGAEARLMRSAHYCIPSLGPWDGFSGENASTRSVQSGPWPTT
jgi:hypothetical protein